eukprot:GEMP01007458.1.p1 GENE.GEMP01007458.1~~GEMP01007458.1.p1  ORF type:complete len:860 (+),score=128.53 GEMP01007458.1:242-2821(+)
MIVGSPNTKSPSGSELQPASCSEDSSTCARSLAEAQAAGTRTPATWNCPSCSFTNETSVDVCILCYSLRPENTWICASCVARNKDAGGRYCSKCGSSRNACATSDRRSTGAQLSPRAEIVDLFLQKLATVQIHKKNAHTAQEELRRHLSDELIRSDAERKSPPVKRTLPSSNKDVAEPITVRPLGKYGKCRCDDWHYLKHELHVGHHCSVCGNKGTKLRCEPCDYDVCITCIRMELGEIERPSESDHSSVSSELTLLASSGDDTPASSSWVQFIQEQTPSTCDETTNKQERAKLTLEQARNDEKRKLKEKKRKKLELEKLRRRRTRKLSKKMKQLHEQTAGGLAWHRRNLAKHWVNDDDWILRLVQQTKMRDITKAGIGSWTPVRTSLDQLPDPKFCCRDLLVSNCGESMADGEYAQYDKVFRNTYNAYVIITWDAETKSFLHLKSMKPISDMETLQRYLINREENFEVMYQNITRLTMQPIALPTENWVSTDEDKWGQAGTYIITSMRIKQMLKRIDWEQKSKEYNTVYCSLSRIPPDVLCKIFVFAGSALVWNWGMTCTLLARDVQNPNTDIWKRMAEEQRNSVSTAGRRVCRRRSFSFCGKQPAEDPMDYVYSTPKDMCRDSNRMNVWSTLANWHRPGWHMRDNTIEHERAGFISNISLDMKRGHLILHVVHSLAIQNRIFRIYPYGASIAKFKAACPTNGAPIFTGKVLWPAKQEVVYECHRERNILVYFNVGNKQPTRNVTEAFGKLFGWPVKQWSSFWERAHSYYYIHTDGRRFRFGGTSSATLANLKPSSLLQKQYLPASGTRQRLHLFDIESAPKSFQKRKSTPLVEFFDSRATVKSPIDTFAVPPEVCLK